MAKINPYPGGIVIKTLRYSYKKLKNNFGTSSCALPKEALAENPYFKKKNKVVSNFINPSSKLKEIFSGSENFSFLSIYVHGSWADETQTPFSDLDDLVIIDSKSVPTRDEAVKAEEWLNKVDMRFCRIDPLQHHGHWIVYEEMIDNYDDSYIPLAVLNNSMRIQGPTKINYVVNLEKTKVGLKRNIDLTCENIHKLIKKYTAKTINSYEMKALVGSFLLMPAFLFQHNGKELSKREAIERKEEIFSPNTCLLLDKCSEIRTHWSIVTSSPSFKLIKFASYVFTNPHLFRQFSLKFAPRFPWSKFPPLSEDEVNKFLKEVEIIRNANS